MTLTLEQVKRIPKLLEELPNDEAVAKELGVSRRAISYWKRKLRESGIDIPKRFGRKPLVLK